MDTERRAAIKARCEAATPGEWRAMARDVGGSLAGEDAFLGFEVAGPPEAIRGQFARGADAVFMAAARQDVPDLLAALEEQEARNQELSRRLALAWSTNNAMEAERQGKLNAMLDGLYTDIERLCEERKRLRQTMLAIVENPQHVDVPLVVQMLRDALGEAAPAGEVTTDGD